MKKIYIIDGNNFIYRMFYWLPEFATKEWKIVNAIFWMAKFFVKQLVREKPDYLFFIKDWKWKNFRHELYSDYKSTRDRMPDNLRSQIWDIESMINKMWIDIIEVNWFEADDVIWTLATKLSSDAKNNIYILTWDKDLYSLVSKNISIYDTMKKKVFNTDKTIEKFKVKPSEIIDYLAIVWDKSDNIPWINWFGPQKAVGLINEFWSIEQIYIEASKVLNKQKLFSEYNKSISSCFKWKTFEKLIASKNDAFLSKQLATIILDLDLWDFEFEKFKFEPNSLLNENIIDYFKSLEFFSLIWEKEQKLKTWTDTWLEVQIIKDNKNLIWLLNKIKKQKEVIIDTETTSLNIIDANLVWISIYLNEQNIYYINRLHNQTWNKINDNDLNNFLNELFRLNILLIWHNIKYDLEILELFQLSHNNQKNNYNNNFWQISLDM